MKVSEHLTRQATEELTWEIYTCVHRDWRVKLGEGKG